MTAATDSGSHSEASAAKRNACPKCSEYRQECACAWCGGPLPQGHRADARYCGPGCRARASVYRRSPEGMAEQQAREADPAYQQWRAQLQALAAHLGTYSPEERARYAHVKAATRSGQVCAECGRELGGLVFWRKVETGRFTEELPAAPSAGRPRCAWPAAARPRPCTLRACGFAAPAADRPAGSGCKPAGTGTGSAAGAAPTLAQTTGARSARIATRPAGSPAAAPAASARL